MTAAILSISSAIPAPDRDEMRRALDALFDDDQIIELRAIFSKGRKRIDAGYFDGEHRDNLITEAMRLGAAGAAIYITLNHLNPQLLSRCANRIEEHASAATSDNDVIRRRWFLIDLDPKRPANTSSTDEQLQHALACARGVYRYLKAEGWPAPLVAASGNGAHIIAPVDLSNDLASRDLVKSALAGLAQKFDDELVSVDQTTFNAARICRLYGSPACKGDNLPDTPWRVSRLVSVPEGAPL